jgi:hypothetical protein
MTTVSRIHEETTPAPLDVSSFRHYTMINDRRNAHKIMVGKPQEKRPFGDLNI